MGEGERGEGSPLTPCLIIFFFCPRFSFCAAQSLTLRTTKKKTPAKQAIIERENELHTNKYSLTE